VKKVPAYARVSKDEYRALRKSVENVCNIFGFEFHEAWDLMIETMEVRHEKFLTGKVKFDMTLAQAVKGIEQQLAKERARRDAITKTEAIA